MSPDDMMPLLNPAPDHGPKPLPILQERPAPADLVVQVSGANPLVLASQAVPPPEPANTETFRLPSTALFLGLVPIFSGQARRGDLAAALLGEIKIKNDSDGRARPAQVRTYIVHSGRESEARTGLSLFQDDPVWAEGELSALIKRQFGPTGLKHLLGIFIAAEEHAVEALKRDEAVLEAHGLYPRGKIPVPSPTGAFVFDINRHLDILGYKRSNRVNGKAYHTTQRLAEAREIVTLLTSLTIVQEIRLGPRKGQTVRLKLLLDEASAQSWEDITADSDRLRERISTNERFILRINPALFSVAAEGTRAQQHVYTHQLKKLARENAHSQALALTMGVHLPIKFRANNCQPVRYTARSFVRMAGVPVEEYTVYEQLERLEKSLRYMVDQGYLSGFETPRYRYAIDLPPNMKVPVPPPAEPLPALDYTDDEIPEDPPHALSQQAQQPGPSDSAVQPVVHETEMEDAVVDSTESSAPATGFTGRPKMIVKAPFTSPSLQPGGRFESDPLDEVWIVEAPMFLRQILISAASSMPPPPPGQGWPNTLALGSGETPPPGMETQWANANHPTLPGVELGGMPPHAGDLLRQVRNKLGLSQSQMAQKLGVTQAAVSMAEAGRRPRMAEKLYDLARRLRDE